MNRFVLNLSLCLFLLARFELFAQEFEVEGVAGYRNLRLNASSSTAVPFRVSVRDCQWRIHLENGNARLKFTEIASDGIDVYTYDFSTDPNRPPDVEITPGPVPIGDGRVISILWLAFCSRCYLKDVPDSKIRPVWLVDKYEFVSGRYTVSAAWSNAISVPPLPTRVVFYSDGFEHPFNGVPNQPMPYGAPYNQGYTQAIYSVSETIEAHGLVLPKDFSVTLYGRMPNGKTTNDLRALAEWHGHVEKVHPHPTIKSLAPEVTGKAMVLDARFVNQFAKMKTLNYWESNQFRPTNNAELIRDVEITSKMLAAQKKPPAPSRLNFLLLLLLMSFALLAPVITVLVKNRSKGKAL